MGSWPRTVGRSRPGGSVGRVLRSGTGAAERRPLSPLLANIMLDDSNRELGQWGHRFVRYADDVRVHVIGERAGQRVLTGITEFVQRRLKLRVNTDKSSVRHATQATVLGFGFYLHKGVAIHVAPKALRRTGARASAHRKKLADCDATADWVAQSIYCRLVRLFALADTPSTFEVADGWLRRRLRQVRWKEWNRPRARVRNLRVRHAPTPGLSMGLQQPRILAHLELPSAVPSASRCTLGSPWPDWV